MNKDVLIYREAEHNIHSHNESINEDNLIFAKRTMLFNAVRKCTDLVECVTFYPEKDITKVAMTLDIAIIDRSRYDRLLEAEKSWISSKNYTDEPKLKA